MSEVVYEGRIVGNFRGFNSDTLFKMQNGTYWVQAQYKYWYHYAYRPEVTITREGGRYLLTVAGNSVPVKRVTDVVESTIAGEFHGWEGETAYTLDNGQVWQQSSYHYEYVYAYRPPVVVYAAGGGYKMDVEGTTAEVRRLV